MKVKDTIKFLLDFDMDAEILMNTGDTFNESEEISFSWGGPHSGDSDEKKDAEFIYIGIDKNKER